MTPSTDPTSGTTASGFCLHDDARAVERIGMTDGRHRQPAGDETPHAVPEDAAILAAPRQRAIPEASHLEPKENSAGRFMGTL